ncbi:complex I subunit 5 family protein [Natronomonas sp. EA1]|uniref:complex I subunit 5 family protein n=1 Tax=Natronomonas sp. EA1 TaxID=3421655 RepID=UPI003EB71CF3
MNHPHIVIAPLLAALVTAIVTLLLRPYPRAQRYASLLGGVGYAATVAVLFQRVATQGTLVYQLSDWQAPFGISLVADALSTFMLALSALVAVPALLYSVEYLQEADQTLSYHALFHFMLVGVAGSFLTGDLFNLFVWFEVMLMSSYVLVVFYSGPEHTRAALYYVVLNLIGGALMLLAIGGLYATTGTLNMADMAHRLANASQYGIDPAPVLGLSALLFAVFALKAGIVPFQFWVPEAYRAAPAPVTAVLAGVVKKVGVYAIVRLYFGVFAAASLPISFPGIGGESFLAFYGPVMFSMAVASILVGGFGAVDQPDVEGVLAYSSIGQIGFIVLPLAVGATVPAVRELAVVAALVYAVNHGVAKGLLFLAAGATFSGTGSTRFANLGGLAERDLALTGAFFVGALALVGIPPLSGFFGKLLVFDVAVKGAAWGALAAALGGAVLTIAYFSRAWNRAFWGDPVAYQRDTGLVAVVVLLAVVVVALGLGFEPFYDAAADAAGAALDRTGYVDAVLEVTR